jgi:hypothetical protein
VSKRWLDSHGDDEMAARAETFWSAMRGDIDAGVFWADRIKQFRDDPGKRLQTAMNNLPLPAAFREAAVALRAIIRGKRKAKEPCEEELGLLYWLAAVESFMLPYAERLQEPGFNVVESIPGRRLRSLAIDYRELGYEKLELLNKTDKKWLVEAWGKPVMHQTLNQVHRRLWDEYEGRLIRRRQAEREQSARELEDLLKSDLDRPREQGRKGKTGCLGVIAIALAAAATAALVILALMERL